MFSVKSDFICIFKIGDNINYNLKVLALLYQTELSTSEENKVFLYKPMVTTIASICEAILYDFHVRIKYNTKEGIRNLANDIVDRIKGKKIDKFEKYIVSVRKNELFGSNDLTFYDELDKLRKLRNRIHIQNEKNHIPRDEIDAFSIERKVMAEKTLERIIKKMVERYSRPSYVTRYVEDFDLPWEEHFPNTN